MRLLLSGMLALMGCSTASSPSMEPNAAPPPPFAEVALSFDFLPYQPDINAAPSTSDPATQKQVSTQLIDALTNAQVPALVFAVCGHLPPSQELATQWVDAGFPLGNQSNTGLNPNLVTVEEWAADVAFCQKRIEKIHPKTKGWFRFPQLVQGWTKEKDQALLAALSELKLVAVPASIPVLDHLYNRAYERAKNENKAALAASIASEYLEHVQQSILEAKELSFHRRGMTTPHIARLHVNTLNADHLPTLLQTLKRNGIRFISVHEAMQDGVPQNQ